MVLSPWWGKYEVDRNYFNRKSTVSTSWNLFFLWRNTSWNLARITKVQHYYICWAAPVETWDLEWSCRTRLRRLGWWVRGAFSEAYPVVLLQSQKHFILKTYIYKPFAHACTNVISPTKVRSAITRGKAYNTPALCFRIWSKYKDRMNIDQNQ
jgi:hypothetical protein